MKIELSANPLVQPYSFQKEATVTTDASEKAIGGDLSQEGHPVINVSRQLTPAEQNYSNLEGEALAIVFVVTRLKQFRLGRRFILQRDHKLLKHLFAPDEVIPKTASARITRWAIALIGFDYELKYTPGEIPHLDALSRMDFEEDESGNDRVCFPINNIYFIQRDLVTQAEIKTELGTNTLPGHNETNQKRQLETIFRSEKRIRTKRCTDYTQWNHLQRCCSFHSTQTTTLCFGQSARDTSGEECNRGISQNDSLVDWLYPRRSTAFN